MNTKIQKLMALNAEDRRVLLGAWFCLGWMRVAVLTLPFKRLVAGLVHFRTPGAAPPVCAYELERASQLGKLVGIAARYTPWQSQCLVQVLVLQRFMAKRGIPGQFYLGVRTNKPISAFNLRSLSAHAWLQCGENVVNGGRGSEGYIAISAFSWGDRGV